MIKCVVPSIRPEQLERFREAWAPLFARHGVTLLVVEDGPSPTVRTFDPAGALSGELKAAASVPASLADLFHNLNDGVRNYGFVQAARDPKTKYILTLDDDVAPPEGRDPVAEHLSVLGRRVPLTWLNTAPTGPFLRGVPYLVRNEGVVMLSHGVWTNVPDFDAPTQIQYGAEVPADLDYYRGPVPKGVLFPLCGMNVMVARDALPYLYFAPMGARAYNFQRFADIWMGVSLKAAFDRRGWACYTGAATVVHTRASDVYKNLAQEAEGLRHNEGFAHILSPGPDAHPYFEEYRQKRERYASYVRTLLGGDV